MIRLILSDMDNTLIPFGQERVSQRTLDAIHACQEQGIDVGPASGRDRGEIASFFGNDASCYNTGVMVNGQRVYYLGEVVYEKVLPRDQLQRVEDLVHDLPGSALITYRDDNFGDWVGATREELGLKYDRFFMCGGQYHNHLPDYPVIKAGVIVPDAQTEHLFLDRVAPLCPDLDFLKAMEGWFDVNPRGWSKANGVEALRNILGLSPEEVCVFGDANNDLAMLRAFPNSCAVANAFESAKEAAAWQVGACKDDGVAIAMEDLAECARTFHKTGVDEPASFMRP